MALRSVCGEGRNEGQRPKMHFPQLPGDASRAPSCPDWSFIYLARRPSADYIRTVPRTPISAITSIQHVLHLVLKQENYLNCKYKHSQYSKHDRIARIR